MYNRKQRDVISRIGMTGVMTPHAVMAGDWQPSLTCHMNTRFSAMQCMASLPSSFLFKNIPL